MKSVSPLRTTSWRKKKKKSKILRTKCLILGGKIRAEVKALTIYLDHKFK